MLNYQTLLFIYIVVLDQPIHYKLDGVLSPELSCFIIHSYFKFIQDIEDWNLFRLK